MTCHAVPDVREVFATLDGVVERLTGAQERGVLGLGSSAARYERTEYDNQRKDCAKRHPGWLPHARGVFHCPCGAGSGFFGGGCDASHAATAENCTSLRRMATSCMQSGMSARRGPPRHASSCALI